MTGSSKFLVTGKKDNLSCARWPVNIRGLGSSSTNHPCARWPLNKRGLRSSSNINPYANYDYLDKRPLVFNKCDSPRCLTCPMADISNITNDVSKNIFCKTYNCIYQLKCGICQMSYIGQTSNKLHLRINVHRDHIRKNVCNDNEHKVEYDHFNSHEFSKATIVILNIQKVAKQRLFFENIFMDKKRTVYPYGLNQIFQHTNYLDYCQNKHHENIYSLFSSPAKTSNRNKRGKKTNNKSGFNIQQVFQLFLQYFNQFDFNKIKNVIFGLKIKQLSLILKKLDKDHIPIHLHHLLYDLILHRSKFLGKTIKFHSDNKDHKSFCVFTYTNKNLDSLNITNIFNKAKKYFPVHQTSIHSAFKYQKSIGRYIYNYNQASKSFQGTSIEVSNAKCICNDPQFLPFIDKQSGHILTGDIAIVQDKQLYELMKNGTNYRFKCINNHQSILNILYTDIDNFIYKISSKYKIPIGFFIEWKHFVFKHLKNKLPSPIFQKQINNNDLKQSIAKL